MKIFYDHLIDKGLSENTAHSYTISVNSFLNWYIDTYGENVKQIFLEPILEFLSYLKTIKRLKTSTLVCYASALKHFAEFNGAYDVANQIKYPNRQQEYLSPNKLSQKEVDNLRIQILQNGTRRDYCIVTIMAYSGLRVSEVLSLQYDDINLQTREIIIRSGKGSKERIAYMNQKVKSSIQQYLNTEYKGTNLLFVSRLGSQIHRSTINKMINKYSKDITPHQLRHFFCTHALEEGGLGIHELAGIAGHKDINTTMKYLHPTADSIIKKIDKM